MMVAWVLDSVESADANSGFSNPLRDGTCLTWIETDRLPLWGAGGGSWQYVESRINWRRLGFYKIRVGPLRGKGLVDGQVDE